VTGTAISSALEQWTDLLGSEFVLQDRSSLQPAETATFATAQRIPAILQPANREQVQDCLRIANRQCIPVYPISSGKNWGYGSRVPPRDRCVLLDLKRLDRIVDFSESLAYVTLEPGVTQRALFQFLKERGSRLWMDATGSSPECSLIGNAMERGFGHTPYGDHFAHVCGLEVVLPDGDLIKTGFARFPGCATAPVGQWGLGPSLDGLFSQSNFGVVTRMTVLLMPAPEMFEAFFFRLEAADGLPALIDALRELRLTDTLRSSIHIANQYKVLGGLQQYPWEKTQGKTPLTPDLMADVRRELTIGYWNASGGLYGTRAQVNEAKRLFRRALSGQKGKLLFVTEKKLAVAGKFLKPFQILTGWNLTRTIELAKPVLGLMRGEPTAQQLASAYWRKRRPPPADPDPDRDGCGLLWYAPLVPADGAHVGRATDLITSTMLAAGYEPSISVTLITPRTASCVVSLNYDRDIEGEDAKARDCYEDLVRACNQAGYYPYRLGVQSMSEPTLQTPFGRFVGKLKEAVDPMHILAPGRYEG
jgi:4-cresol dehydrogenase (hydroxylating) flavoprotein subunit